MTSSTAGLETNNINLPVAVQGWHLLRRANLSKEQRQLVMTQAPGLEKTKIQETLFLLFGQDFKGGSHSPDRRWKGKSRRKGYAVYEYDEENDYHEDGWEDVYYENEEYGETEYDYEAGEEFDGEAIYYQDDAASNAGLSQEDQHQQVEEYDEAFAAYVDARRRFNEIKLSRGFLPIVALSDPQAGNLAPGLGSSSPSSSKGSPGGTRGRKEKGVVERITSRVLQGLLEKARSRPAVRLELVPTTACDVERMDIVLLNVQSIALPTKGLLRRLLLSSLWPMIPWKLGW